MPQTLTERAQWKAYFELIRETVVAHSGSVQRAAAALGMTPKKLSAVLNGPNLRAWWLKQRYEKRKRSARERRARWRDRRARGLTYSQLL